MTSSFYNKCFSLTGVRTTKRPVNKCLKDLAFIKKARGAIDDFRRTTLES